MQQPIAFGAPRVPTFAIERPRLLERLDAPASVHLVRAAAGTGKTTLLASWFAREHAAGQVWVSIDESTRGRDAFWAEVVAELRQGGVEVDADAALTRRELGRALAQVEGGLALVLDDADHAEDAIFDDLLWLVERVPGLRVVVASRAAGPLESVTARARVEPEVIDGAELLFTEEELGALLGGAGVDAELAGPVRNATGGVPLLARTVVGELGRNRLPADPAKRRDAIRHLTDRAVRELGAASRILAEWLHESGDPFAAFTIAVGAGDYELASRITRTSIHPAGPVQRHTVVRRAPAFWVSQVPSGRIPDGT